MARGVAHVIERTSALLTGDYETCRSGRNTTGPNPEIIPTEGGAKRHYPPCGGLELRGSAPLLSIPSVWFLSIVHRFLRRDFISGKANRNDRLRRQGVLLSPNRRMLGLAAEPVSAPGV